MLLRLLVGLCVVLAMQLVILQRSEAAAPGPCNGNAQISDATGDGHHNNTDVTSAWFSEESGGLQVVVKAAFGDWQPAHEDSNGAGWAFLFKVGSQTRYVRIQAPFAFEGPPAYDYGTWTLAGGFASQGATTGLTVDGPGGTVTIDVPAATGAVEGAVLTENHVLTYDGFEVSSPHWVDRAPGGTAPGGSTFGADFVVGACGADPLDPDEPVVTTALGIDAPSSLVGAADVAVTGTVSPPRGGVEVDLTVRAARSGSSVTSRLVTADDGSYSTLMPVKESSLVRAVAVENGLGSETLTVTMKSRVRIKVKRLRHKAVRITGRTDPGLPGRILWLRSNGVVPIARTSARGGRFHFRFKRLRKGRYQAVFIPSDARAERATSNTGVIK